MLDVEEEFTTVQGAEARIDLVEWYGKRVIRKTRIPKSYRSETLDKQLRQRRTKEEVEILYSSKLAGVDCPEIFFADPESSEIMMEYVSGVLLKNADGLKKSHNDVTYQRLGTCAARLHARGIIHGDLTTKNVILSGDRIVLIDFGLAFISDRIEDKAEDLHLLKQALKSSNSIRKAAELFENMMKGYELKVGSKLTKSVREQIAKIERRGRYAQVD